MAPNTKFALTMQGCDPRIHAQTPRTFAPHAIRLRRHHDAWWLAVTTRQRRYKLRRRTPQAAPSSQYVTREERAGTPAPSQTTSHSAAGPNLQPGGTRRQQRSLIARASLRRPPYDPHFRSPLLNDTTGLAPRLHPHHHRTDHPGSARQLRRHDRPRPPPCSGTSVLRIGVGVGSHGLFAVSIAVPATFIIRQHIERSR